MYHWVNQIEIHLYRVQQRKDANYKVLMKEANRIYRNDN